MKLPRSNRYFKVDTSLLVQNWYLYLLSESFNGKVINRNFDPLKNLCFLPFIVSVLEGGLANFSYFSLTFETVSFVLHNLCPVCISLSSQQAAFKNDQDVENPIENM